MMMMMLYSIRRRHIFLFVVFSVVALYFAGKYIDSKRSSSWQLDNMKRKQLNGLINCRPKKNIFFLKTHKCASSTVQNILLRFGFNRGLNFVLPTLGNYLGNQAPFSRLMTANSPWHSLGYNIFCHHTVYNEREVEAVMPSDTIYIGILRDPVDLFESLYSYSRLDLHYKQSIQEFARSRNATVSTFRDRAEGYLGVNQMLYDFGVKPADFGNLTVLRKVLKNIERRFSLVMIAEHFDESMILLKELLCWTYEDVVYFRHNVRKTVKKKRLAKDIRMRLNNLNASDRLLYKHFLKQFWQKVRKFGFERMQQEVKTLQNLVKKFRKFCRNGSTSAAAVTTLITDGADGGGGGSDISAPFSEVVQVINVRKDNVTCMDLAKSEITFTHQLKMLQMMKTWQNEAIRTKMTRTVGRAKIASNYIWHQIKNVTSWLRFVSKEVGFAPVGGFFTEIPIG